MSEQFIPLEDVKIIEREEPEQPKQEEILPPAGTFFIRGVSNWTAGKDTSINYEQISISLHKDGQTTPIRPYGFILKLDPGAIVNAYDRDITTEASFREGTKFIAERAKKKTREYTEEELGELMENTSQSKHNEIIVKGNKVEVIGAYIIEDTKGVPGIRKFRQYCSEKGFTIHIVPKIEKQIQ